MKEEPKLIYRPMQKDDLDSVMVIDQLSFSMPWPRSTYLHDLTNYPKALLWVAEDLSIQPSKHLVGMIDVWLILDEAHIATLAVHPDYRGRGIASRLIKIVLLDAYKRGASQAMLEVRESNFAAQNLYKQFGFKVVHRRRRYYVDNKEDALLMNLENLEVWVRNSAKPEFQIFST